MMRSIVLYYFWYHVMLVSPTARPPMPWTKLYLCTEKYLGTELQPLICACNFTKLYNPTGKNSEKHTDHQLARYKADSAVVGNFLQTHQVGSLTTRLRACHTCLTKGYGAGWKSSELRTALYMITTFIVFNLRNLYGRIPGRQFQRE